MEKEGSEYSASFVFHFSVRHFCNNYGHREEVNHGQGVLQEDLCGQVADVPPRHPSHNGPHDFPLHAHPPAAALPPQGHQ